MATISLQPTNLSVSAGQTFPVQVIVNANGDAVVSAQFQMSYPQSLLKPISFTFAPGWTQTFDIGTDVLSGGTIAQAGGYPATFQGSKVMGTLTFQALRSGEATLAMSASNSFIFETDSGNKYTGPAAVAEVGISPGNGAPVQNVPTSQGQSITALAPLPSSLASTSPNSAASAAWWVWLLLAVVIAFIIWRTYRSMQTKNKKRRR